MVRLRMFADSGAHLPPYDRDVPFIEHDTAPYDCAHNPIESAMTIAAIPLARFEDRSLTDPLTAEHRRELSAARDRAKTIRKAARVAAFNGWTSAIVAAFSAPFSLFSPVGLALTVGIALVAFNEFRGRKRLLNFDPSGATLLGWNQLGLLAMIVAYCLWMMQASAG